MQQPALSPPGKAERMQLLPRTTGKACAQLMAIPESHGPRCHLPAPPPLQSMCHSHCSGEGRQTRAPTATGTECDRGGSAPGEASQPGNELCWPAELWERTAELGTPEGAEQAKHSSMGGTQASVEAVQRKEHFRETGTVPGAHRNTGWIGWEGTLRIICF